MSQNLYGVYPNSWPFIAESREVVRQLLASSRFRTRAVLLTRGAYESLEGFLTRPHAPPAYLADRHLLKEVTGYNVHRGCIAAGERGPGLHLLDILRPKAPLLVGLSAVTDPDNVGVIFRTALAFGVSGILLSLLFAAAGRFVARCLTRLA